MESAYDKYAQDTVQAPEPPGDALEIMSGPEDGRIVLLTKGIVMIGRLSTNDLALQLDPSVSRTHARLIREENVCSIEDLHSRFGTEIDGLPVLEKTQVSPGSTIRVGDTLLLYRKGRT